MQRESLHCGELIKRLNDILGRCSNEELRADDMTSSQVKMLMIINETKDECITLKELEKHFGVAQATIAGTAARLEKTRVEPCAFMQVRLCMTKKNGFFHRFLLTKKKNYTVCYKKYTMM